MLAQTSFTATTLSASFNISTIWLSVNRDFFIETSRQNPARKFCFLHVFQMGKLTVLWARILEGMTVTKAAKELRISRVTVSKVLNGKGWGDGWHRLAASAWLGNSP
jgi:hypothetical protein